MSRVSEARKRRRVISAHRILGLAASVVIAVLAVTGVLLNHAARLELHDEPVRSELMLDWYGMSPESDPMSFELDKGWIVGLEGDVYWNAEPVSAIDSGLVGAVALPALIVVASPDAIVLLSNERRAAVVDRLDSASLPGAIERIGIGPSGKLLAQVAGGALHRADDELLDWQPADAIAPANVAWSHPSLLPPVQRQQVLASYRGDGLTRFRVLSDLHTGRILGSFGPWLVDGAAAILLLLTCTGIYNWIQIRRSDAAAARRRVKEPAPSPHSVYEQ